MNAERTAPRWTIHNDGPPTAECIALLAGICLDVARKRLAERQANEITGGATAPIESFSPVGPVGRTGRQDAAGRDVARGGGHSGLSRPTPPALRSPPPAPAARSGSDPSKTGGALRG